MAKQIKDNKKRIVELEKKFKKDLAIKTDTLKNDYKQMINKLNKDHQNNRNNQERKHDPKTVADHVTERHSLIL